MNKTVLFPALLAVMTLLGACTASAQIERFQGEWKNTNRHAVPLVKLDIDVLGNDVEVHAWADCGQHIEESCGFDPPPVCRWVSTGCGLVDLGTVRAEIYSTRDSGHPAGNASTLLVRYPDRLLVLESQGDKLSADVFTDVHVEQDLSVSVLTDTRFGRHAHVEHDLFKH
jgi:hypothetical protein